MTDDLFASPEGAALPDDLFATPERLALRETVRRFVRQEVVPHLDAWEDAGEVPRDLHLKAAKAGLLAIGFPEHVGGSGGDLIDSLIVTEEIIQAGGSSGLVAALFTHGIALPHIISAGNEEQIDRFVRPVLAGEAIASLAVTEPDGGSDVAATSTSARHEGDHFVVNGTKTYITSAMRADFVTTVVRTGEPGGRGISLLIIESDTPGLTRTPLRKMGWHCSDTAEIGFAGCRVPVANLVGEENAGFAALMEHFQTERLNLAVHAYAIAQRCLDLTLEWTRARQTFGRPLISRQLVQHTLTEMARRTDVARTYVRQVAVRAAPSRAGDAPKSAAPSRAGDAPRSGTPGPGGPDDLSVKVSFAKNTAVEACSYVVDAAVQLHGGLGYVRGIEVERHYRDARILGIGGGSNEVLTEYAARRLGFNS